MRVHLLKPLHGWRAFAGEVGVVVLGVLLALGAQQWVERISWKMDVTEAKQDLAAELELDLFNAQERVQMETCIERRLNQLNDLIDHPPPKRWTLLPGRGVVPIEIWSSSAWDTAVADGAVSHMSRDERTNYASIYSYVRGLHAVVLEEYPVSVEFRMLEHGGPLSEASQDRLRADVARVHGYNRILAYASREAAALIEARGVRLTPAHQQEISKEGCALPKDTLGGTGKA
jgi:hypothetical protein